MVQDRIIGQYYLNIVLVVVLRPRIFGYEARRRLRICTLPLQS